MEYFGTTVADIFNTMPKRFIPEEAKDVDIVIGYEATGPGGGKWKAIMKHGTLKVETVEGELTGCNTTIQADAETFVGVTLGKITAIDALTNQKLRVVGDVKLLMTLLPKVFVPYSITPAKKEVTARDILSTVKDRFRRDKAQGVTLSFGYDLAGEGGGQWSIIIKDGKCTVKEGLEDNLTVKMTMDAGTYVGMMTGTLDTVAAFTSGKVKIDGDMMAAGATAKYFNKYVDPNAQEAEELLSVKVITSVGMRFATGPVMGKWFKGMKEKKFLANVCPSCKRTQIPPREVCAFCHIRAGEYVELGPEGTVTNYDIVYYASPDPLTGVVRNTPYAGVFVMLDGATEQEALSFELKTEDIPKLKKGARVRPVWSDKPKGHFSDILYFEIIN